MRRHDTYDTGVGFSPWGAAPDGSTEQSFDPAPLWVALQQPLMNDG